MISALQLDDIKRRNPVDKIARKWVTLRRHGKGLIGACPICSEKSGSKSATRFEVSADRMSWVCAVCGDGGDVIKLLRLVEHLDFAEAIARLGGAQPVDETRAAELEAERQRKDARRRADEARYREQERARLFHNFWCPAKPWRDTPVEDYLRLRLGSAVELLPPGLRLRFAPELPLFADGRERDPIVAHVGPVMLAAIVADGKFVGLHQTWLDLARHKGRAVVSHPNTGELLPSKKVRGTKAGGYIELVRPPAPFAIAPSDQVVGEGIEKVLAVLLLQMLGGRDVSRTAYGSAIDLGNLGGRHLETVSHPTLKTANNRAQRVPGPDPDMTAPAWPVPDTVERLVLIGDSTSDRFLTECAIARAVKRYARPGLAVSPAWSPEGKDFDDVLRGQS